MSESATGKEWTAEGSEDRSSWTSEDRSTTDAVQCMVAGAVYGCSHTHFLWCFEDKK